MAVPVVGMIAGAIWKMTGEIWAIAKGSLIGRSMWLAVIATTIAFTYTWIAEFVVEVAMWLFSPVFYIIWGLIPDPYTPFMMRVFEGMRLINYTVPCDIIGVLFLSKWALSKWMWFVILWRSVVSAVRALRAQMRT